MKRLFALAVVACLAACTDSTPAPQAEAAGSGMSASTGALLGAAAGYMVGRSAAPTPAQAPVVHNTTVVRKTVIVNRPAPRTYSAPARSFSSGRRR